MSGYQIVTAVASSANLGSGIKLNAKAQCPSGTRVLGGGIQQTALLTTLLSSYPDTNQSWFAEIRNNQTVLIGAASITVYAICAIAN
jgi:hypothetical protein